MLIFQSPITWVPKKDISNRHKGALVPKNYKNELSSQKTQNYEIDKFLKIRF